MDRQKMSYRIEYAYVCHIGKVRNNNEDNFWCCGESLPAQNQGMDHIRSGSVSQSELPLLAVFDGMGGESCGEMASFLAADACGEYYDQKKKQFPKDPEGFLKEICTEMNRAVCDYSTENKIRSMGTTAAMLVFSGEGAYGCNLGDSRIYQSGEGLLRRVSQDHVLGGSLFGKSPLVQYVGIPEEHMALEPSLVRLDPMPGMRYLLCSDGLTDMLSDGEIADILTREITVRETVELLLDRALKKGGRDNTTVVLCEVRETEKNWLRRWVDKIRKRYEGEKDEEPNAGSGF